MSYTEEDLTNAKNVLKKYRARAKQQPHVLRKHESRVHLLRTDVRGTLCPSLRGRLKMLMGQLPPAKKAKVIQEEWFAVKSKQGRYFWQGPDGDVRWPRMLLEATFFHTQEAAEAEIERRNHAGAKVITLMVKVGS